jgi:predicted AlkP superfamily pyrophosphatase or phosphodiesterase
LLFRVLLLVLLLPVAWLEAVGPARHVVLISLDGLRPEFYLDPAYPAPTLRALAAAGSQARRAEPVFPPGTYPTHATIVTGVRPSRHGILFNGILETDDAARCRRWKAAC